MKSNATARKLHDENSDTGMILDSDIIRLIQLADEAEASITEESTHEEDNN